MPQRNTACWPEPHGLLSPTTHGHLPRSGTIHSGLSPSTSIISEENVLPANLQANLRRAFLSLGSLFPADSSLYQSDRTLITTPV